MSDDGEAKEGTEEIGPPGPEGPPKTVRFHYIKSNHYRVAYADGAWGGVTARGRIVVNFWNERAAIPQEMLFELKDDGNLGKELIDERKSKQGFIREVEVAVMLDLAAAKSLQQWLEEKIKHLEAKIQERDGRLQ